MSPSAVRSVLVVGGGLAGRGAAILPAEAGIPVFTERRHDRAAQVVAAGVQTGQWHLDLVRGDVPALMEGTSTLVSVPA